MKMIFLAITLYAALSSAIYGVLYHLVPKMGRNDRAMLAGWWPLFLLAATLSWLFSIVENEMDLMCGKEENIR